MSENKFYVYLHKYASGPKAGQVFYVGKGQGSRAYTKSSRSRHWRNIVNKYGLDVCISARFEREECSFSFERAVIAFIGRCNLINLTDGGEGISGAVLKDCTRKKMSSRMIGNSFSLGYKHSDETKQKMSKAKSGVNAHNCDKNVYTFYHRDGSLFTGMRHEFRKEYNIPASAIHKIISGELKSTYGWSMDKSYALSLGNRMCEKVFKWHHPDHGEINATIPFIASSFHIDRSALHAVASKKRRIHKGWRIT